MVDLNILIGIILTLLLLEFWSGRGCIFVEFGYCCLLFPVANLGIQEVICGMGDKMFVASLSLLYFVLHTDYGKPCLSLLVQHEYSRF